MSEIDDVQYQLERARAARDGTPWPTLAEVERALILDAVTRLGAVPAAVALGIGKTTIYRKLLEYGVDATTLHKATRLDA